jgi:UDP-2-acetamido-2-deoxy-ribo-hexuluronate aminotransferase
MTIEFIDLKAQYQEMKASINLSIHKVLEHGQYIMGPEVEELEKRLCHYTGARHCISVASGTDALLISLMSIGLKPGDEVITTPFTFVATAEVIVLLGAKPIFVDIEPDTCNIDVSKIEAAITDKTIAIMPVSLYGQPADMDEINEIAHRHNLVVIEDAAQSFGAQYKGNKSCNLSTIGCTSFFPSKPLGCYGDGGAIFTSNDSLAKIMREIRVHGQQKRYVHTRIGVGGRMDTLQCAILLAKFDRFEWEVEKRIKVAHRYNELLESKFSIVSTRSDRSSVFAQYTIFIENRQALQKKLSEKGIPTSVHYPIPLNEQAAYRGLCHSYSTPHSHDVANKVMSLPMGPYLSEVDQDKIVLALMKSLND